MQSGDGMNGLYLLVCFIGGAALAFQASVNSEVGRRIGTLEVACLAYGVGTLALAAAVYFGGQGNFAALLTLSKWKWFAGLLGATYIFIIVLSVPKIGVAPAIIATIAGQLFLSTVIDHFGLFGNALTPVNGSRIAALGLMLLATYLFYKD